MRAALQEGLSQEASTILGGDAELQFTYRFASEDEKAWMKAKAELVAELVDFRSMAIVEKQGQIERALVQVKGIDDAYPIYGSLTTEPDAMLRKLQSSSSTNGIIAEATLIDTLGLKIGDTLSLGTAKFELLGTIEREPDAITAGFSFGPRVIVLTEALAGSGLIGQGTLFNTKYKLKLPGTTDLAALKVEAEKLFPDSGMRWRDRRNAAPGLTAFVDRIGAFLVLVGLAGLIVGGVGVSTAVRSYLSKKMETIATLKTIGANGSLIFKAYFTQIAWMASLGIVIGLLIGTAIPALIGPFIAHLLPFPALFGIYAAPIFEATIYGILTSAIFTLWPLAKARDVRAAGLFRDQVDDNRSLPRARYIIWVAALVLALIAVSSWLSGAVLLTVWTAVGVVIALALLAAAARLTMTVARHLTLSKAIAGRPALRLALASVGSVGGNTTAVILSLGLGLSVLASIGQINGNMRNMLNGNLPQIAPAYFVVDIQNDQLPTFLDKITPSQGVSKIETAAMLRGIVTQINGLPAQEVAGDHWVLRGDRGISYADVAPNNSNITNGSWWPINYAGPPLISFAEEEGAELGLSVGDKITVNILGRGIEFEIANFRAVDFGNMGINFVMIVNEAALKGAPHSHIATVYAEEAHETQLLRTMTTEFPNITALRTRDAIERVSSLVGAMASATSWAAAVTLLTGLAVLVGAAAADERQRNFEAAVFKAIGATRGKILQSFAIRSAIMGASAGIVAMLTGATSAWVIMRFIMDAEFIFEPVSAFLIVFGGIAITLLTGLFFASRPLSVSPAQTLRAKD